MFVSDPKQTDGLNPCGLPEHEDCGLRAVLDRLGERWSVMVLAELSPGPRRFRQMERALPGISQRMLTLTVRRLERDGLVGRTVGPESPPSVTYALTDRGRDFAALVKGLVDWARVHREPIEASRARFDAARR